MADEPLKYVDIPLTGRWRPSVDGTELTEGDFQMLTNMRYGEVTPKSVRGMTKINASVVNATNIKIRTGFHFRKSSPSESHCLVEAWNDGLTASKVYDNTTAVPSAGGFTATEIWENASSPSGGRFSNAPDGCVAYCNGKESTIWGGAESRIPVFVVGTSAEVVKYDYTDRINNTLTDTNNVAVLTPDAGTIDTDTVFLLHLDNDVVDASATPHTVTNVGSAVTFSTSAQFGTHCAVFNGTTAELTTPDHADFNFHATDIWTMDFWMYGNWTTTGSYCIYSQRIDANNYTKFTVEKTATGQSVRMTTVNATVETLNIDSGEVLTNATWHHIAFVENGDEYYVFVDGQLKNQVNDTDHIEGYSSVVHIGANFATGTATDFFKGNLDEFRITNGVARWTDSFAPEGTPYGTKACYVYIGSLRPIQGLKIYTSVVNASAGVCTGFYWASSKWNSILSLVDNTSVGGITLSRPHTITFPTTVSTAKTKTINRVYCYWYRFIFSGIDDATSIYYATLDAPMQPIVDIWDGSPRHITAFYKHTTKDIDNVVQVSQSDYVALDTLTYCDLSGLTAVQYIQVGFAERMTGFEFTFAEANFNTTACNMTVYYWNGAAWVAVSGLTDGTRIDEDSFGQSGTVIWDAPLEYLEFKTNVSNGEMWWYYKIMFSKVLSATVYLDYITGIPAQYTINAYKYPVMWQNRLWLLNEASRQKNSARCSSQDTVCVFNGTDSGTFVFGNEEDITAGAPLFTRFGSSIYDNLVILKNEEVWIVDGTTPGNYAKYKIANNFGCIAPHSLVSCDMGYEIAPGVNKQVLIWQSHSAVVVFDGNTIVPISADIENYFDPTKTECIVSAYVNSSKAFFDPVKFEYHLLIVSASGTTKNVELVYDLRKQKWFKIDRGAGNYIQCGFPVKDTTGNSYTYGGLDTGYMERLEYGTTFDETTITSTMKTADVPLGDWYMQSKIRRIKHIAVAKTTTTQTVTLTHYSDGVSSSTETASMTLTASGKRVAQGRKSVNWDSSTVFHSFQCAVAIDNENVGYEPIGLAVGYRVTREDLLT